MDFEHCGRPLAQHQHRCHLLVGHLDTCHYIVTNKKCWDKNYSAVNKCDREQGTRLWISVSRGPVQFPEIRKVLVDFQLFFSIFVRRTLH